MSCTRTSYFCPRFHASTASNLAIAALGFNRVAEHHISCLLDQRTRTGLDHSESSFTLEIEPEGG